MWWTGVRDLLLKAPEGQLNGTTKDLIRTWDAIPAPIDILKALDNAVLAGGASDFVIDTMNEILKIRMRETGDTMDDIVKLAVWREKKE